MAKGVYTGVSGVKTSKKMWVGAGGVRKVKKIFGGVGGIPRLMYSLGIGVSNATYTTSRIWLASAKTGGYAVFAGGNTNMSQDYQAQSNVVDAYNTSLIHSFPTVMSESRRYLTGVSFFGHAIFIAGARGDGGSMALDAYNASLVRSSKTLSPYRREAAGGSNSNYAVIVGGRGASLGSGRISFSNAINTSFVEVGLGANGYLPDATSDLTSSSIGENILFGGGTTGTDGKLTDSVHNYNGSAVRSLATPLSKPRSGLGSCTVGNYVLFGGGDMEAVVDAYNTSLVRSTITPLSVPRRDCHAVSIKGEYAIFPDGLSWDSGTYGSIPYEYYDKSLVKGIIEDVGGGSRYWGEVCEVGNYAILAGGRHPQTYDYLPTVAFEI